MNDEQRLQIAEDVGLIGPRSRIGGAHLAAIAFAKAVEATSADQAQRIADLEAEHDELAHGHRSQHDADSIELRRVCADRDAARKERDGLRARLAEIEGQGPVAQVEVSVPHLRRIFVRDIPGAEIPAVGVQLYARPVPAIPVGPRQAVLLTDEAALSALPDCHGQSLGKTWLLSAVRAIGTACSRQTGRR
jgi:hypothetical protein